MTWKAIKLMGVALGASFLAACAFNTLVGWSAAFSLERSGAFMLAQLSGYACARILDSERKPDAS